MTGRERVTEYAEKWGGFATLHSYWNDPTPFEAEQAQRRRVFNKAMAAHDARERAKQEERWDKEAGDE